MINYKKNILNIFNIITLGLTIYTIVTKEKNIYIKKYIHSLLFNTNLTKKKHKKKLIFTQKISKFISPIAIESIIIIFISI